MTRVQGEQGEERSGDGEFDALMNEKDGGIENDAPGAPCASCGVNKTEYEVESFHAGYRLCGENRRIDDAEARGMARAGAVFVLPEPVDLVSEGAAIAEMLAIVTRLSDQSRPRALNAVFDLVRTAPGIARVPPLANYGPLGGPLGGSSSAENLQRLNEVHGFIRDDGDESP